jgi:osmotically-inducible protein OsmY
MTRPAALLAIPGHERGGEAAAATNAAALPGTPVPDDLRLAERVGQALRATGYLPVRAVEVTVTGRVVLLRGRVPSYYLKQVAQAVALDVPGVRGLWNDVDVVRP